MSNVQSNVGDRRVYEAGDQRKSAQDEIDERERYKEGTSNSHKPLDSKDERTIANKLDREAKRKEENEQDEFEVHQHKKDATLPATYKGNEPSKGAKIDQELREEEEEMLRKKKEKKGDFGPNN